MADPMQVHRLAEFHINRLLPGQGWQVRWDHADNRAGACYYQHRCIVLSEVAMTQYSLLDAEQVIFHEIAHALTGAGAGHGKKWLETAQSLGYTGDKYAPKNVAGMGTGIARAWFILAFLVLVFFWNPIGWLALAAAAGLGIFMIASELRPTSQKYEGLQDWVEASA